MATGRQAAVQLLKYNMLLFHAECNRRRFSATTCNQQITSAGLSRPGYF